MAQKVIRLSGITGTKEIPGSGLLPVSPATIWRWVKAGKFPKPFKLGVGTTVFDLTEVETWIAAQKGGI